jgi:predicted PurR-regulated permease PerM
MRASTTQGSLMMTPDSAQRLADKRATSMQRRALAVLYIVLTGLAAWVLHDFIPAVVWAGVIAIALWPLLHRLETLSLLRGRHALVAVCLTLAVTLLFVLPLGLALGRAAHEAHGLFEWLRGAQANGIPLPDFVNHLPLGSKQVADWWRENLAQPLSLSPAGKALHGGAVVTFTRQFGGRAVHMLVLFGFMLMTLFFVFRAGPTLSAQLLNGLRRAFGADGALLATRMAASVRSTVTGLVVVGIGEGALLGVAYLVTGVPHAALLGTLTAVAAMLPFCAPITFAGAALWLLAQGSTVPAIGLVVFGFIVVFIAEHFVRPVLIGGAARLPFLLVLFGILGGAETFGLVGLFIGPAMMTVLMMLWTQWVG